MPVNDSGGIDFAAVQAEIRLQQCEDEILHFLRRMSEGIPTSVLLVMLGGKWRRTYAALARLRDAGIIVRERRLEPTQDGRRRWTMMVRLADMQRNNDKIQTVVEETEQTVTMTSAERRGLVR